MNYLELEFRKQITKEMNGLWIPTIHVENHLNPGVPDMSYVMNGGSYETGWLELKAVADVVSENPRYHFKLEPSQHRWIEAHHLRVPVHLLLSTGRVVWLVSGAHHGMFSKPVGIEELRINSVCGFQREALRRNLHDNLKAVTDRRRFQ